MIVRKGRSTAQIERTQSAVSYAILITFLLFVIFPFYWMIVTSFKSENQMRSLVSMFWPSPFATENYEHLLGKTEFVAWYKNSIIVSVSSTFLATAVGTLGAYALARLKFLGRAFMASTVLITYLVPPSILFIPLYAQIRNLGLSDSLTGLIAAYPSFTVPFVTWLLMGYFESIPVELEESAMIDGATRFGAFRRVILPLAAPGLLAERALRVHPGLERVPVRPGLHHQREAAHAAGRPLHLHHRRRLRMGLSHGRGGADDPAGHRGVHLPPEVHGRRPHRREREGLAFLPLAFGEAAGRGAGARLSADSISASSIQRATDSTSR